MTGVLEQWQQEFSGQKQEGNLSVLESWRNEFHPEEVKREWVEEQEAKPIIEPEETTGDYLKGLVNQTAQAPEMIRQKITNLMGTEEKRQAGLSAMTEPSPTAYSVPYLSKTERYFSEEAYNKAIAEEEAKAKEQVSVLAKKTAEETEKGLVEKKEIIRTEQPTTLWQDIKGFVQAPSINPAKAANIVALSKETGLTLTETLRNYDEITKQIVARYPTWKEIGEAGINAAIVTGLTAHPLMTLGTIGIFMGLDELENLVVSKIKKEPYQFQAGKGVSDLLEAEGLSRDVIDLADFLAKGVVAGKVTGATKSLVNIVKRIKNPQEKINFVNEIIPEVKTKVEEGKPFETAVDESLKEPVLVAPEPTIVKPLEEPLKPEEISYGKEIEKATEAEKIPEAPKPEEGIKEEIIPETKKLEPLVDEITAIKAGVKQYGRPWRGIIPIEDAGKSAGDLGFGINTKKTWLELQNAGIIKLQKMTEAETKEVGAVVPIYKIEVGDRIVPAEPLPEPAKGVGKGIPGEGFNLIGEVVSVEPFSGFTETATVAERAAGKGKVRSTILKVRTPNGNIEEVIFPPDVDTKLTGQSISFRAGQDIFKRLYAREYKVIESVKGVGKEPELPAIEGELAKQTRREERLKKRNIINPETDDLLTAIAKAGGLDYRDVKTQWGTIATDILKNKRSNTKANKPIIRVKGGLSIDYMAEKLAEHGYLTYDLITKHDLREFSEKFDNSLRGKPTFSDKYNKEIDYSEQYSDYWENLKDETGINEGTIRDGQRIIQESAQSELGKEGYPAEEVSTSAEKLGDWFDRQAKETPTGEGFTLTAEKAPAPKVLPPKQLDLVKVRPKVPTTGIQVKGEIPEMELISKMKEAAAEKAQGKLFEEQPPGVGTQASVGAYNIGEKGKEPLRPPTKVNFMEMPEMVEFFQKLSKGAFPKIRQKLRAARGMASGVYKTGKGEIDIKADIFKDPEQAKATFAHEIFHFIDDLPDYMLKQRGNILGRIASFKKYLKDLLEEYPGSPQKILTPKDRAKIRQEAERQAKVSGKGKQEIIPEDIIDIWNSVIDLKPYLTDYIKTLADKQKIELIKSAFRGQFPSWFNFKSATGVLSDIRKIYADLLEAEIERRGLFKRTDIMNELKTLSKEWRPWDEVTAPASLKKYRNSPTELYADAGSVLLNRPDLLQTKAPKFYKAFFNWLERKPEVKQIYEEIQARIASGEQEILANRRQRVREMFGRGEEKLIELTKEKPLNILDSLRKALVTVRTPIIKMKSEVQKRGGKIEPEHDPYYWTEELPYISAPIFQNIRDLNNNVLKPARKKGITETEIGEYLKAKREATERAQMANPLGFTEADALKQLDYLKQEIGDEKFVVLENAVKEIHRIRSEQILPVIEKSRALDPETMTKIKDNVENYATFQVQKYLEDRYGAHLSSKIYRQVGTFQEILNPLTATAMKDMSLVRMAERKMIADELVSWIEKEFPDKIKPADTRWNGKYHEIKEPKNPEEGLIAFLHEGKAKGFYVDKDVAKIFEQNPYEFGAILKVWAHLTQPIKEILVSKNPGWMTWNIQRDIKASAKQLPKMTLPQSVRFFLKGIPDAYKDVFKGISTKDVREMYDQKILHVGRYWGAGEYGPETHLDKIVMSFGEKPVSYNKNVIKPFQSFINYLKAGVDWLDKTGQLLERTTKIGGYKYLKQNKARLGLTDKQIAHLVRARAGSPNFWERGNLHFLTNNTFLFSTAGKEGIRASYEAYKENKPTYVYKTIKYDIIPKLIMFGAATGLLGEAYKKLMDNIGERDKANYITIPVGKTKDDKTVYFVMPHDFQGQVIAGTFWKILNKSPEYVSQITDYLAGGIPYTGLNPLIQVISDTIDYMRGKNPYDSWRGKEAIPERIFEAGGWPSFKEFLKHEANKVGGGVIYRFKGRDLGEVKTELERVLGYPIVANILGRFVRISNQGRTEKLKEVAQIVRKRRAGESLEIDDKIIEHINEPKIKVGKQDAYSFYIKLAKEGVVKSKAFDDFYKRYSDLVIFRADSPEAEALITAKSNEEKIAIFNEIMKRNQPLKKAVNE